MTSDSERTPAREVSYSTQLNTHCMYEQTQEELSVKMGSLKSDFLIV